MGAVHQFMAFESQLQSESGTELTFVEIKILTYARLDASLAKLVTSFREDGTD